MQESLVSTQIIGLELKVAMQILSSGTDDSKVRALLYRPAIEPILMMHGPGLDLSRLLPLDLLHIASALAGRSIIYRPITSVAGADNGKVEFETIEPRLWSLDLQGIINSSANPITAAAGVFARTIFAHPLADANGRMARFLAHLLIARALSADVAPLALAPSFYRHRIEMADRLLDLSRTGDWQPYYQTFDRVVRSASHQARKVLITD